MKHADFQRATELTKRISELTLYIQKIKESNYVGILSMKAVGEVDDKPLPIQLSYRQENYDEVLAKPANKFITELITNIQSEIDKLRLEFSKL